MGLFTMKEDQDVWEDLPIELLKMIAQSLEFVDDVISFSYVCKSWKLAAFELEPWLHSNLPCLLLAEDPGLELRPVKVTKLEAILSEMDGGRRYIYPNRNRKEDELICGIYELFRNPACSIRGWFSLATQQIYNFNLPEATDKLILGTNNGWLVTLGRDFEAHLLHPLSRRQIPLPPMPERLPYQSQGYTHFQQRHAMYITKVVISSKIAGESALHHQHHTHLPTIIMVSYTGNAILGFARLGDKFWTNVEMETSIYGFEDIVYHKKRFYAIDFRGTIVMCDIVNNDEIDCQCEGKIITSIPVEMEDNIMSYLVESLSGSHIWLVLRFRGGEFYHKDIQPLKYGELFYHTINFKVFKLEIQHSSSDDIPTCVWTPEVQDLGNEALFIGRSSSMSIVPSKFIQSNSIYFTDDSEHMFMVGGGYDMGIFDMKNGKIRPHFQGMPIHHFSPSLWCV